MIYDNIKNLQRYEQLMPGLAEALHFLQGCSANIQPGRYALTGNNYVNVDAYDTKVTNPVGYEAHRKYIDVQFLAQGHERVLIKPIDEVECTMPYDGDRDVAFFSHTTQGATELTLGDGRFVVLFPDDAHEPQLCIGTPEPVIKIVAKIEIK